MIEAIISRLESPILDITHEILSKECIASPEAIRNVDSSAGTLLVRLEGLKIVKRRAPDDCSVDLHSNHEVGSYTSGDAPEIVCALRSDEVRDDMPSGPIAAHELVMIERQGRGPGVFEPTIQPVLTEESEEVHTSDPARGHPSREKIRSEPVASATLDTVPTRVVPIKLPIEPE